MVGLSALSWRKVVDTWDSLDPVQREWRAEAIRRRAAYAFYTCCEPDEVDRKRIYWANHRDEMLSYQKECAKAKDFEGAKFFKQEATEALKHYRGCCLILGHLLCEPPGDSPFTRTAEWPLELCDYAVSATY